MPDCLYIGIDFGTTFSGAAWAFSRQPSDIKIITKWQADHAYNTDDAKTPTRLVYAQQKVVYRGETNNRTIEGWGYQVKPDEKPLKWFKLCLVDVKHLDPEIQESEQLREAQELLDDLRIKPVDAATDFLRKLWQHTIGSIERALGKSTVEGLPFKVVVTVPAIWPDSAMQRTEDAARRAGILKARTVGETTLDLVPEPEAAALATLAEFRGRPGVKPGDVITVCDCGGGTVDITSYEMEESDPVIVKECVVGDGKMCGSIFLDEAFEDVMRTSLGKRWEKLKPEQIQKVMNDEWEYGIKRLFQNDNRDWEVRLPSEATSSSMRTFDMLRRSKSKPKELTKNELKVSKGGLKLTSKQVLAIFDPVVSQIEGLVGKQIQEVIKKTGRSPKCVLLVGGFGRCTYLYQALRNRYENQGIDILQGAGDGPWTAICRGAVIRAMSGGMSTVTVTSRISRRNYGLTYQVRFDPNRHLEIDKVWSMEEAEYKADNQMHWYLRKNVDITEQEPVSFDLYLLYESASEMPSEYSLPILSSETDDASNRKTKEVTEVCQLGVRIDTPFDELPIYTNKNGDVYRKVQFDIEMTCSGTVLKFSVIMNGIRQPAKNVQASFEPRRIRSGAPSRMPSANETATRRTVKAKHVRRSHLQDPPIRRRHSRELNFKDLAIDDDDEVNDSRAKEPRRPSYHSRRISSNESRRKTADRPRHTASSSSRRSYSNMKDDPFTDAYV